MNFRASVPAYGPVQFTPVVPPALTEHRIPGSKVYAAGNLYGQLMLQEIKADQHTALLAVFKCEEDTNINIELPEPGLRAHFVLQGHIHLRFEGLDRFSLKPNHCNMYYSPYLKGIGFFKKGVTYILLDVTFPIQMLENMSDYFSIVIPFLEKIKQGKAAVLSNRVNINKRMSEIIHQVTQYSDEDELLPLFVDDYFRSLMLLLIREASRTGQDLQPDTLPPEMEKLYRAEAIIRKNISIPLVTGILAEKLGMGEGALNKNFKEVFGVSPATYSRRLRLEKSKELMKNKDKSLAEIATFVGFKSASNFIRAFKKEYKITPHEWREKINDIE